MDPLLAEDGEDITNFDLAAESAVEVEASPESDGPELM
jgi:hypothetical protein